MSSGKNNFKFTMPAYLEKSKDGEWRLRGLASTEDTDQQGEIIIQKGIDLTPIDQKKGYFNFDHQPGAENLIGVVDGYHRSKDGLYVEGRLFKNHDKAKAVYQIMSSLSDRDKGRVGLSVEGSILERDPKNPKIIKKCRIKNVAVTFNPVNDRTYADLVKSMSGAEVDFNTSEEEIQTAPKDEKVFSASEVVDLISKALSAGAGYTKAPADLSGGEALSTSDMADKKKKKKKEDDNLDVRKSLRKMSKELYKSNLMLILDNLQKLYPDHTRADIWAAVKKRMETKYPVIASEN